MNKQESPAGSALVEEIEQELRGPLSTNVGDLLQRARDRLSALERELAEARADVDRIDWLEAHIFSKHWDGTIGRPADWQMAGPYRHRLQKMRGPNLRAAIDAALAAERKETEG